MISVIVPVYNSERYISEAIESICNQSNENWEFIDYEWWLNRSYIKISDDYANKDSYIRIFHIKMKRILKQEMMHWIYIILNDWKECYMFLNNIWIVTLFFLDINNF